ncbi:MAG: hypothetical protein GX640_08835 [Fibrobacter sp.]|nr:hypothetical protein [Fibrobacter sp.]
MKTIPCILIYLSITGVAGLVNCNNKTVGFTLRTLYTREKFSGVEMNGRTIGISPLLGNLNKRGMEFLNNAQNFNLLQKTRSNLSFISTNQIQHDFLKKWSYDSLNLFWNILKNGEVASISLKDSLWQGISSDYLLVFRVVSASTVKTFNHSTRKKLHLETELWDCYEKEVLWRISINGISLSESLTDSLFLLDAAQKAVAALPEPLPGYGMESW